MKYIILTLLFLSTSASAENWLNHSKIKSGSVEAYSLKSDCERISGEKCFDLGDNPSTVFIEFDKEIDDLSKPLYSKSEIQSCASIGECDQIHSSKICSNELESSIKNYELLEVYCSRFLSYEKKPSKTIKLDEEKVKTHIEKKQKEIELKEAKKKKRLESIDSLKAIDWAKVDTIAKLKVIVKALVDETLKDEE